MQTKEEPAWYSEEEIERIQRQADRLGMTPETLQWMLTMDKADEMKFNENQDDENLR